MFISDGGFTESELLRVPTSVYRRDKFFVVVIRDLEVHIWGEICVLEEIVKNPVKIGGGGYVFENGSRLQPLVLDIGRIDLERLFPGGTLQVRIGAALAP